jgi:hypothetical protein
VDRPVTAGGDDGLVLVLLLVERLFELLGRTAPADGDGLSPTGAQLLDRRLQRLVVVPPGTAMGDDQHSRLPLVPGSPDTRAPTGESFAGGRVERAGGGARNNPFMSAPN